MIQIATPSRERVEHYQRLRAEVEQAVGRINGAHSRVGHPVLHYLHQSLPREELAAFFAAADVMLVTPLRDGMNLVAKEYVASRPDLGGVLVLSEFTGAAAELKDALLVNPHDIDGLKAAIVDAFAMPAEESSKRMRTLRRQVLTHDVDRWARTLPRRARPPGMIDSRLAAAPELLVALDFDGTLAPIVEVPADARALPAALDGDPRAGRAAGNDRRAGVRAGAGRPGAVSGLGPPVRLIGSHGLEPDGDPVPLDDAQRERLDRLNAEVDALVDGEPGVRTERKPAGVAVHVRGAAPEVGTRVLDALRDGPAAAPGIVSTPGKAVLDLAVTDMNKGIALDRMRGDGGGVLRGRRRHRRDGVRPAAPRRRRREGRRRRHRRGEPGARPRGAGGPAGRLWRPADAAAAGIAAGAPAATEPRTRVPRCCHPGRLTSPRRTSRPRAAARSWCRRSARSAGSPGAAGCGRRAAAAAGPRPGPSPARAAARW